MKDLVQKVNALEKSENTYYHFFSNNEFFCFMPESYLTIFSERTTLRSLYAMSRPSVVCLSVCLSSVCDVGAPYSGG